MVSRVILSKTKQRKLHKVIIIFKNLLIVIHKYFKSFSMLCKSDLGQQLLQSSFEAFLWTLTTLAISGTDGNIPVDNLDMRKIRWNFIKSLRIVVGTLFGPTDILELKLEIILEISFLLAREKRMI